MRLLSQTAAAAYVRITPRTISLWIQHGKLTRRRYKRVALEDVERLVREGSKRVTNGVAGGFSGGWIQYPRSGRPLAKVLSPWRRHLEVDSEGHYWLWKKPLEVGPETPKVRGIVDVERNLEIRVLGWVWSSICYGDSADEIWNLPAALRFTPLIASVPPLRFERALFPLLRHTSPREVFVITACLVYDYVHHAVGDAAPNDVFEKPITRKEQRTELQLKAREHLRRQQLILPLNKQILFEAIEHKPSMWPTDPELKKQFEGWKAWTEQWSLETKYGRRMAAVEPTRGIKRWYTLGKLLAQSNRMASYWRKRTSHLYEQVVETLDRVTPRTMISQKTQSWKESLEEMFGHYGHGESFR